LDKKRGRFADPEKVRRLDYEGKHYHSRGPFTVPRSAQGHPVIIQAGQSGRGTRFAGRWAEVVFSSGGNAARAKEIYSSLRDEIAKCGRDPDQVAICNAITIVAGESQGDAEDKMAVIEKLPLEIDQLSLLAEGVNFDFAGRDLDAPLSDADLASFSGMLTIRDSVIRASGKKNPSTRDFITINHRGKVSDAVVGGPKEVADRLEEMFVDRHCDGFVVAATHIPGAYADFVRHVVPELQRRGLYHDDYAGPTLRDNLGLPPPRIGDWK
ncbi:MAG: LLM class flavin-dependent oxidoreductase, partial [Stellaceae bacterium]